MSTLLASHQQCFNIVYLHIAETEAKSRFLLHHSNTDSEHVYAMKSLSFSILVA